MKLAKLDGQPAFATFARQGHFAAAAVLTQAAAKLDEFRSGTGDVSN